VVDFTKHMLTPGGQRKPAQEATTAGVPPKAKFGYLRGLAEEIGYESGLNILRKPFSDEAPVSMFLEDPTPLLKEWEEAHPVSDVAATVGSFLIPYGGQVKAGGLVLKGAAKVAPKIGTFLKGAEEAGKAGKLWKPFLAETAKLTAAEPLKLGLAAASGASPEDIGEIAAWDAIGQPIGLGLSGAAKLAGKGIKSLAKSYAPWESANRKLRSVFQNFPIEGAVQDKLKFLRSNIGAVGKDSLPWVQGHINALEKQLLSEEATGRYVGGLASGAESQEVNKLFLLRAAEGLDRKLFTVHPTHGFSSRAEADVALKSAGLPEGWSSHVQFPRMVTATTKAKGKAIQKTVTSGLEPTHAGWFIGDETEGGLYVMAKKIKGEPKGGQGDSWVVLKTSDPNAIIGRDSINVATDRAVQFSKNVRSKRAIEGMAGLPADAFPNVANRLWTTFTSKALEAGKGAEGVLSKIPGAGNVKSGLKTLINQTPEIPGAAGAVVEGVRGLVVPAQREFAHKPLAEQVRLVVSGLADLAREKSNSLLYGKQGLAEGQSLFGKLLRPATAGGLKAEFNALRKEDRELLNQTLAMQIPVDKLDEALAKMKASPEQMQRIGGVLRKLQEAYNTVTGEEQGVRKAFELEDAADEAGNYLVSHMFRGTHRQRVLDGRGKLIAMGSGINRGEALKSAERLAEEWGGHLDDKGPHLSDFSDDARDFKEITTRQNREFTSKAKSLKQDPLDYRLSRGVKSFSGHDEPMTANDIFEVIRSTVSGKYKYMAEQTIKEQIMPEAMEVFHKYGKKTFDALAYRVNQMFGIKGPVNKAINRSVDKVLAPMLGRNSADRLVGAINKGEMHLSLMMGNLAHPLTNMLTFMQTVMPKLAYVQGVEPAQWGQVLGYGPDIDLAGRVTGVKGVLEPIKIAMLAFKDMARPDKDLRAAFDRAAGDGVITAGIQERYIGENSVQADWIRDRFDLGDAYEKISSIPFLNPATKSEELSRAHAFVAAHRLFKQMGVTDPEMRYQLSKQFTHRSMYQYTTADRPKLFNGPLGSLFGLFKNWTAHYMSDMWLYGDAAVRRGQVAPLLWSLGGTGAIAGAGGLPLYGMADGLSRVITDQPLMDHISNGLGELGLSEDADDTVFYGLPALFGTSLQANASSPGANPLRDVSYLTNFSIVDRFRKIGGAANYLMEQIGAGQGNPLENEQIRDKFAYALAPKILYKAFGQIEDGMLKASSTGQPITSSIFSTGDWLQNMFSITPLEMQKAYQLNEELYQNQEAKKAQTSALGEAYFQAWKAGNSDAMKEVLRTAMLQGANVAGIARSAKAKMRLSLSPSLPAGLLKDPELLLHASRMGMAPGQLAPSG